MAEYDDLTYVRRPDDKDLPSSSQLPSSLGPNGGLKVEPLENAASTTGGTSSVPSSASVVTILAANTNRRGASVFNDSTQALYIKTGAAASTSSYTVKVLPGGYFELPFGYTGILTGIWDSANGNARVTEYT